MTSSDSATEVSIVIPCLNESATIAECVRSAQGWLERSGASGEIIVVDNGSTDDTARVAREAGATVLQEKTRGKGNAVRAGIAAATGRFLVMSDGDGTYDLSDLGPIIEPLQDGYDLVIGDRLRGAIADSAMPWHHRYIGNPFFNALITVATRRRFDDCLSGLRAFTLNAWNVMSPESAGFQLESEMCLLAAKHRLRVKSIPIPYDARKVPSKLSSVRDGFAIAAFIMKRSPATLLLPVVFALAVVYAIGAFMRASAS
jgi:glycosyltransferase involved in cell wall biosynthesis